MEEQIKQIIAQVLSVDPSVLYDELSIGGIPEWDSIGNLAIISTLEEQLGIEFPIEDLFELTSISAIVNKVKQLRQ